MRVQKYLYKTLTPIILNVRLYSYKKQLQRMTEFVLTFKALSPSDSKVHLSPPLQVQHSGQGGQVGQPPGEVLVLRGE